MTPETKAKIERLIEAGENVIEWYHHHKGVGSGWQLVEWDEAAREVREELDETKAE